MRGWSRARGTWEAILSRGCDVDLHADEVIAAKGTGRGFIAFQPFLLRIKFGLGKTQCGTRRICVRQHDSGKGGCVRVVRALWSLIRVLR